MLSFVLAESALELVPAEIRRNPAVVSDSKRREVPAARILLDRSFHHPAMARLKDGEKRGRPDLVHMAILSATGTPLFLDGQMRMYVHTCQDVVLEIKEGTRVPKSYFRFRGLVEKLLEEMPREGLIPVRSEGIPDLVRRTIGADLVVGMSTQGRQINLEELAVKVSRERNPCVIVGGFPHGHFTPETLRVTEDLARIHPRSLEAHVVAGRVIYEIEKAVAGINH